MGLLQQVFDFGAIKALFARKDFSFVYDGMHGARRGRGASSPRGGHARDTSTSPPAGVQGPYAKKIFVDEFGAPASSLMNCEP